MKAKIYFGLGAVFIACCLSVHGDDTAAQAAARAALEQALGTPAPVAAKPHAHPAFGKHSWDLADQPAESSTNQIYPVPAEALAPQTAPATTAMVAVPVVPAVITVPATNQPAALPVTPKPSLVPPVLKIPSPSLPEKPTNEIVTVYGMVYKNAKVEKVEANGIIISYWTSEGGFAMCKVYFVDLPYEFRRQYLKN